MKTFSLLFSLLSLKIADFLSNLCHEDQCVSYQTCVLIYLQVFPAFSHFPLIAFFCSPSGNIYDKEVIYKYLLSKIKELKRAKKAYQKQLAADASGAKKEAKSRKRKAVDKFLSGEGSTTGAEAAGAGLDPKQFFEQRTDDIKRLVLASSFLWVVWWWNMMRSLSFLTSVPYTIGSD